MLNINALRLLQGKLLSEFLIASLNENENNKSYLRKLMESQLPVNKTISLLTMCSSLFQEEECAHAALTIVIVRSSSSRKNCMGVALRGTSRMTESRNSTVLPATMIVDPAESIQSSMWLLLEQIVLNSDGTCRCSNVYDHENFTQPQWTSVNNFVIQLALSMFFEMQWNDALRSRIYTAGLVSRTPDNRYMMSKQGLINPLFPMEYIAIMLLYILLIIEVMLRPSVASALVGKAENDMLQCFINLKYKDGRPITEGEITGLVIAALFTGQHTSFITSTWTGAYLLCNNKYMSAVVDEQKNLMKKYGNKVDHDILSEKEVHYRLPHIYKDPDTYDPNRFAPGREEDKVAEAFSYISFGRGRYGCLGEPFAYLQIKAIWCHLLRNFEFGLFSPFPEID
ncbi:hypothetical protein BC332_13129 [Capsicum chinense]|nr:hypothetical protein BC332_13129 [Capsicum chinense]